jgi:hypothetical protein
MIHKHKGSILLPFAALIVYCLKNYIRLAPRLRSPRSLSYCLIWIRLQVAHSSTCAVFVAV